MIALDFRCAPSMAHTLRASCGRPNLLLADLCGWQAPATESIVVTMVEEARACQPQKDKRDKSAGQPICTAIAARRVASRDGLNERIQRTM